MTFNERTYTSQQAGVIKLPSGQLRSPLSYLAGSAVYGDNQPETAIRQAYEHLKACDARLYYESGYHRYYLRPRSWGWPGGRDERDPERFVADIGPRRAQELLLSWGFDVQGAGS